MDIYGGADLLNVWGSLFIDKIKTEVGFPNQFTAVL